MHARALRAGLAAATAVALIALSLVLVREARDPEEAVRLRNSLLASVGVPQDFSWAPAATPASFLVNRDLPPESITLAAQQVVTAADGWSRGLQIATHLGEVAPRGGAIQSSTAATYRTMRTTGGGYCADYTQVFIGLATAAGLPVREWGLAFDGFGGNGHAIVEVYDDVRGQWLMLDPFNSFYPADAVTGEPLSVLEFRARVATADALATTRIVRIVPAAFGFSNDANLVEYFQRGVDQFYLWWGTNIFSYEHQPLVAAAGRVSRSVEQVVAIATGVHPGIRIYPTPRNRLLIDRLAGIRTHTLLYGAAIITLFVLLCGQGWLLLRYRRDP
jgi:hypothetical protein